MISVIAPIYNEAKTLETNIIRIRKALRNYPHEIIIVDDNSPDGSGQLADELTLRHPDIKVLHRPMKMGLGTAYKDGFHLTKGDLIVSIDSDLSHDPSYLPKLIDYRANDITHQEQDDINPIPSQTVWEVYCCPTDLNTLLNDNKISVLFYEWIQES